MVLGAPQWSDVSPVFTHGWPRRLVSKGHGGFKAGNITCTARVSNIRIRSVAVGDVACFLSTEAIYGAGLTLSNLVYLRRSAIKCAEKSYRMPVHLLNSTLAYGLNFATMTALTTATIHSIGEELFIPYWRRFFSAQPDISADEEGVPCEQSVALPEATRHTLVTVGQDSVKEAVDRMMGSLADTPRVPGLQHRGEAGQQVNRAQPAGRRRRRGGSPERNPVAAEEDPGAADGGEDGAGGAGEDVDGGPPGDDDAGEQQQQQQQNDEDGRLDGQLGQERVRQLKAAGLAYSKSPAPEQLDRVWQFMVATKPLEAAQVSSHIAHTRVMTCCKASGGCFLPSNVRCPLSPKFLSSGSSTESCLDALHVAL